MKHRQASQIIWDASPDCEVRRAGNKVRVQASQKEVYSCIPRWGSLGLRVGPEKSPGRELRLFFYTGVQWGPRPWAEGGWNFHRGSTGPFLHHHLPGALVHHGFQDGTWNQHLCCHLSGSLVCYLHHHGLHAWLLEYLWSNTVYCLASYTFLCTGFKMYLPDILVQTRSQGLLFIFF